MGTCCSATIILGQIGLTYESATSEKFTKLEAEREFEEFRMEEVKINDGKDGKPVWVTYGGNVYDITDFVANHP